MLCYTKILMIFGSILTRFWNTFLTICIITFLTTMLWSRYIKRKGKWDVRRVRWYKVATGSTRHTLDFFGIPANGWPNLDFLSMPKVCLGLGPFWLQEPRSYEIFQNVNHIILLRSQPIRPQISGSLNTEMPFLT